MELDTAARQALTDYLLFLGDDRLILGHRLSEWCGHGPALEEDIALANIALDCIGQGSWFLGLAGEVEGSGRSADDLAFFRDATKFRNSLLTEQPNGDFALTIARQFLLDCFWSELLPELMRSAHAGLAAIAEKAAKEVRYHLRHSGEWLLRLGDGTVESHTRMQQAVTSLWPLTGELFENTKGDRLLIGSGLAPDHSLLFERWSERVTTALRRATLAAPENSAVPEASSPPAGAGRDGRHSEHLTALLAEMQSLARAHPGATW